MTLILVGVGIPPSVGRAVCGIGSARGGGAGFLFRESDRVVTARHVVAGLPPGAAVSLTFADGERAARVLFEHPWFDLAVLEVTGGRVAAAALEPAREEAEDGPLLVLEAARDGGPLGHEVAAYQRTVRHRDGHEEALVHFPAPARPVRSGSPLVDATGGVVAVVTDGITLGGRRMIRGTSIMGLHAWWTQAGVARR